MSAFGGGYFDDSGDVPGSSVLPFHLVGTWNAANSAVELRKQYSAAPHVIVQYTGRLSQVEGAYVLTGTWTNAEGTHGSFACRREQQ